MISTLKVIWSNLAIVAIIALGALLYFEQKHSAKVDAQLATAQTDLRNTEFAFKAEQALTERLLDQAERDSETVFDLMSSLSNSQAQIEQVQQRQNELEKTDESAKNFLDTPTGPGLQRLLDDEDRTNDNLPGGRAADPTQSAAKPMPCPHPGPQCRWPRPHGQSQGIPAGLDRMPHQNRQYYPMVL